VKPAFYQSGPADASPIDAAANAPLPDVAQPTLPTLPDLPAASAEAAKIEQCLAAIEQLQARMDQLHNQNQQILAALGLDDQQPAPPPPAGSLAARVLDLQEAVELLAANGEALRRVVEEQTVSLKPTLPAVFEGKLTVENHTDSDRQIWINGISYWIWAGNKLTVPVPVGEVTTKVAGEEAKTWEVAQANEEVRIEIVRTSEITPIAAP
jgi:hypothetical protein